MQIRVKKTKKGFFITAHEGGKQIGEIGLLHLRGTHYRVSMIAVKRTHQNKGIGTKLMTRAMKVCGSIELGCFHELYPFYQKFGFKVHAKGRKTYELIWNGKN